MRIISKNIKFIVFIVVFILSGCEEKENVLKDDTANYLEISKSRGELSDFTFDTISIYCSPSLEIPIFQIKNIFEEETGCEIQINVASKEKIQEQIKDSKYGELYISDSIDDFKDISKYVSDKMEIAVHTPVLAVKKGEFSEVKNLDDLIRKRVVFLNCGKDTAIGEVSQYFYKSYSDKYVFSFVDNIAEEEIYQKINDYENCAAIVWKENSNDKNVDIIEIKELTEFSKYVTVGKLKTSVSDKAAIEFIQFLNSEESKKIWEENGYTVK